MADLSGSTQFCSIKTILPSGLLGGVYFETLGSTPSLLNNYAFAQLTVPFGGVWAAPQSINITAERIGNTVTLTLGGFNTAATTAGTISTAPGALPSEFCPVLNTVYCPGVVLDNSVNTLGMVSVSPAGIITVSVLGANFAATGLAGWEKTGLTYTTISL